MDKNLEGSKLLATVAFRLHGYRGPVSFSLFPLNYLKLGYISGVIFKYNHVKMPSLKERLRNNTLGSNVMSH